MAENPQSKKSRNKKDKKKAQKKAEKSSLGAKQSLEPDSKSTVLTAAAFGAVTAITLATFSNTYAGVP